MPDKYGMNHIRLQIKSLRGVTLMLAGGLALLVAGGCDSVTVERGPVVSASELGLPEGLGDTTGFVLLEDQSSSGRFPGALAVARWRELGSETEPACRQLITLKPEQAVHWNSLFNSVPAIREVIMLRQETSGPAGAGVKAVAANAARFDARLCLVYGAAAAEPDSAALIGVLLDTNDGSPVAYIQARATPADFEAPRPDGMQGDRRHVDVVYLATRRFQDEVRRCVLALIQRDGAGPKRESPWRQALEESESAQSE